MTRITSPYEVATPLEYIETTIPAGMTATEFRRSLPQRRRWWRRAH